MTTLPTTFTGSTPEQIRDEIVKMLTVIAVNYAIAGRTAKLKGTMKANIAKRDALEAAATFIEAIQIKHLPKQNKCPNCGEEMI